MTSRLSQEREVMWSAYSQDKLIGGTFWGLVFAWSWGQTEFRVIREERSLTEIESRESSG